MFRPTPCPRRRFPSRKQLNRPRPAAPEDRQAYLDQALSSARSLAGSLAYLSHLHAQAGQETAANPDLVAVFQGLKQQADWVLNFLEECR